MGISVLIVDDHEDFRGFARRLLESGGFTVVGEAGDAGSALAEAKRLRPQVVLLDIGLPDGDGIEVARRLTGAGVPAAVLVSSREEAAYGPRLWHSGVRGFIPKAELSAVRLHALLGTSA
jgi:DNA-binding NarL/FixJ family response regulator